MSNWMKLTQDLKQRLPLEYLTATQKTVYEDLYRRLKFPNWINLYGKYGVGKTFVAWAVSRAVGGQHISSPTILETLSNTDDPLLIDNVPYHESQIRQVLAKCGLLGAKSVILITRQPATMPMQKIELHIPNQEDINFVFKTLGGLGYYPQNNLPSHPNLWDVLQAYV